MSTSASPREPGAEPEIPRKDTTPTLAEPTWVLSVANLIILANRIRDRLVGKAATTSERQK